MRSPSRSWCESKQVKKQKQNVHWSGLLQSLGKGDYLLVEIGSDTKYDAEQDNVNAEVATGSHLENSLL
jgi:glucose/arabinose dehydrogenase